MNTRALTLALAFAAGCSSPSKPLASASAPESSSSPEPDAATAAAAEAREAEQIAAIEFAVNTTGEAVHACYKRATAERLGLEGVVVLEVVFGADGAATVALVRDGVGSEALSGCLLEVVGAFEWPPVFAAGEVVQLPLSFVGAREQYTVHAGDVTVHEVAPGLRAAVVLDAASTGNGAAALSLLELGGGFEVPLHVHDSTEVLYVLEGGGTVYGARGRARGAEVAAGAGIYLAAGVAHGFATGPQGARMVQLYAPAGAEQRFEGDAGHGGTTALSAREARKLARRGREPRVARRADAKSYAIAGGKGTVTFLFDPEGAGDSAAYFGVLRAEPGMQVPEHAHEGSTELLYVLTGDATLHAGGGDHVMQPGTAAQLPPQARHAATVGSDAALEVLQFYAPAGPEQRFKR